MVHPMRFSTSPRAILGLVAAALVAGPRAAHADSDGYYCVGHGFLAVEFRSFNTRGLGAVHVLEIARLDTLSGARWTDRITVDDFQTHVLVCGARTILFEGAGERGRGLVSYLVEIDSAGKATISKHSNDPTFRFFGTGPTGPPNLGDWARRGVITFTNSGGAHFQLRVTEREHTVRPGLIRHDLRSTLELIVDGRVRDSFLVHEGHRIESIDDS